MRAKPLRRVQTDILKGHKGVGASKQVFELMEATDWVSVSVKYSVC